MYIPPNVTLCMGDGILVLFPFAVPVLSDFSIMKLYEL